MDTDSATGLVAQLRGQHAELRGHMRHFSDAILALELHESVDGIASFLAILNLACREHFPVEERVCSERLADDAPAAVLLLRLKLEHDDLRSRAARIASLLETSRNAQRDVKDVLYVEALQLQKALACHLCFEERSLLRLLDDAAAPAAACKTCP
jgi:hemerythrin-like domain-containing protein